MLCFCCFVMLLRRLEARPERLEGLLVGHPQRKLLRVDVVEVAEPEHL